MQVTIVPQQRKRILPVSKYNLNLRSHLQGFQEAVQLRRVALSKMEVVSMCEKQIAQFIEI